MVDEKTKDPAHQDPEDEADNTQGGPTEEDRKSRSQAAADASTPPASTDAARTDKNKKGRVLGALDRLLGRAPADEESELIKTFAKLTGYKEDDVYGLSTERRTVVTKNGGKYLIKKSGKSFRTISGPAAPSEKAEEEDDE